MTTITLDYHCRNCGSNDLELVAHGKPTRSEQSLIVTCTSCHTDTHLLLRSLPLHVTTDPNGCGTPAGYTRHMRAGTTPCQDCRDAHSAAAYRRKHKQ